VGRRGSLKGDLVRKKKNLWPGLGRHNLKLRDLRIRAGEQRW